MALQLGHRMSEDFDLFNPDQLEPEFLSRVEKVFLGKTVQPLVNNPEQLTCLVDKIKLTFLQYPFPIVRDLVEFQGQRLLGVPELTAVKAYTIGRRGSFKDYVDIYFSVSENHISLPQLLVLTEEKYGDIFNSRLFLEQLAYLDDVQDAEIKFLKKPISKSGLQRFFEKEISSLSI